MRAALLVVFVALCTSVVTPQSATACEVERYEAIVASSERLIDLQRTDADWEGTWYWYVGSTYDATNLTGITALGLLAAYEDTKDMAYLAAAVDAASFIESHLGANAFGTQHHERTTAPDIIFLDELARITGETSYSDRALAEWENLKLTWPTAADLNAYFVSIGRQSAWDIAYFLEAAHRMGDTVWADDAAQILSNTTNLFYYGVNVSWYYLNVANVLRVFAQTGYDTTYLTATNWLHGEVIRQATRETGVQALPKETAYGILALNAVGDTVSKGTAEGMLPWLFATQTGDGGWIQFNLEFSQINGEVLRALSRTPISRPGECRLPALTVTAPFTAGFAGPNEAQPVQ